MPAGRRPYGTPLGTEQIRAWAGAHFPRTGRWPNPNSGPVLDAPDETWAHIKQALVKGLRGWGTRLPYCGA
jgi:hypothetical protein